MAETIFNAAFFNTELISIFPTDESLKGIFAYLRYLDGAYNSRYSVSGDVVNNIDEIVQAFESQQGYINTKNEPEITFSFKTNFIATNYTIASAYEDGVDHTYMKSWNLIGVDDNDNEHIIDSQTDYQFCEGSDGYCREKFVRTFQIKRPKAYKNYILRSLKNSKNTKYLVIRFFDFYGVLCSNETNRVCYFPHYRNTCISKRIVNFHPSFFIFILQYS